VQCLLGDKENNPYYWSSTEHSYSYYLAWIQFFSDGYQSNLVKTNYYGVRAIRAFKNLSSDFIQGQVEELALHNETLHAAAPAAAYKSTEALIQTLLPEQQKRYVAEKNCESTVAGGLSFKKGDVITIIDDRNPWQWMGELNGKTGWVPPGYMKPL
jgi:hypothetical protein